MYSYNKSQDFKTRYKILAHAMFTHVITRNLKIWNELDILVNFNISTLGFCNSNQAFTNPSTIFSQKNLKIQTKSTKPWHSCIFQSTPSHLQPKSDICKIEHSIINYSLAHIQVEQWGCIIKKKKRKKKNTHSKGRKCSLKRGLLIKFDEPSLLTFYAKWCSEVWHL